MFGLIGAGAGALGGLFGGLSKNAMLNRQIDALNEKKKENQNWYDRRYNEDATQRADAQRLLSLTEESIKKRNRAAAGTAAVMGGTDESVAATKDSGNKAMSDAVSQVNAAVDARKDRIEQQYMAKNDSLDENIRNLESQKQGVFEIGSNMLGGAASGLSMFGG